MVIDEHACFRYEGRNLCRRKNGIAVDECQVDADTERRRAQGERCGIIERRTAWHDGRRAQDTVRNALFYRCIDQRVPTEIVGIQNDLLQDIFLCVFSIECYDGTL